MFLNAAKPGQDVVTNLISLLPRVNVFSLITWALLPQLSRSEGRAEAVKNSSVKLRKVPTRIANDGANTAEVKGSYLLPFILPVEG